jgi:hypothetical protein
VAYLRELLYLIYFLYAVAGTGNTRKDIKELRVSE